MLLRDLRRPFDQSALHFETRGVCEANPMSALRFLSDRTKCALLVYWEDHQVIRCTCVAFDPKAGLYLFSNGENDRSAYQSAQAEYWRDTRSERMTRVDGAANDEAGGA